MFVLVLASVLTCPMQRPLEPTAKLVALEVMLNEARPFGEPMVLRRGDDFESAHGTVLFLSRDEGARRLVQLARAGRDEVSAVFLPCWDAWIVDTVERWRDRVKSDFRYGVAALTAEHWVQYWHTHNALYDEVAATAREREEQLLGSMAPSDLDMLELYAAREEVGKPLPGFRGVVAGVLGTVTFWNDDLKDEVFGASPVLLPAMLKSESELFLSKAKAATPQRLQDVAASHRGIFWYCFEPLP